MQAIETPTIRSLSGVLKSDSYPVYLPHQTNMTESHALDAIITHMNRDSLRIDLLCSSGPIHWHDVYQCWMAWGNFTIASGGFEVLPLSGPGMERLADAFFVHRQSEHYKLAICAAELERRVRQILTDNNGLYCADKRMEAWRPFIAESRAIDARLEAIYEGK